MKDGMSGILQQVRLGQVMKAIKSWESEALGPPIHSLTCFGQKFERTVFERNKFIFISDLNSASDVLVDQFKRDCGLVTIIWPFFMFSFCLLLMLILLWLDQRITFTWSFFQSLNQFKGRNKKRPLWKKMFNGFNLIR
jgi:hypothetical protein